MVSQLDVKKIASRYAKALFDHAQQLDDGQVGATINALVEWFGVVKDVTNNDDGLLAFLNNPTIDSAEKLKLVGEGFKAETVPTLVPFLKLVAENDRLTMLGDMADEFNALVDEAKRIKDAYVTVPVDLDKSLSSKFETRLKEAFDLSDVRLHVTVDPDVIAGAVVRIGDQLIDGSAAGKLRQISKQVG